jgi:hypothetical protein
MPVRLVGAGLPRTGTHSLKVALEQLLGSPCYHMIEVFRQLEHVPLWHQAIKGDTPEWRALLGGYGAAVDWPASAFWKELADAYPDAVVLLSVRDTPEAWWKSADETVFEGMRREHPPAFAAWLDMCLDLLRSRFTPQWEDSRSAMEAYAHHNDEVRSTIPKDRLVEWRPGDGWAPICSALDLPIPDEPFPHVNTTAEFRANLDAFQPRRRNTDP